MAFRNAHTARFETSEMEEKKKETIPYKNVSWTCLVPMRKKA